MAAQTISARIHIRTAWLVVVAAALAAMIASSLLLVLHTHGGSLSGGAQVQVTVPQQLAPAEPAGVDSRAFRPANSSQLQVTAPQQPASAEPAGVDSRAFRPTSPTGP